MLLNSDPATNLYQIDVLLRNPLPAFNLYEWRGVFVNQELIAISLSAARLKPNTPSSLCVPFGDLDGCRLLGEAEAKMGGTENLLGPKDASDMLYDGLGQPEAPVWTDEQLYVCQQQGVDEPYLTIRPAKIEELDVLEPMAAQMQIEDIGSDPRKGDIDATVNALHSKSSSIEYGWQMLTHKSPSLEWGTHSPWGPSRKHLCPHTHETAGHRHPSHAGCQSPLSKTERHGDLAGANRQCACDRAYQNANYVGHTDFRLAELNLG